MPFEAIPPQYDHPPKPPMQIIEKVLSFDELQTTCSALTGRITVPGEFFAGCGGSYDVKGNCIIWITPNVTDYTRRHEIAHCNGWGKGHPPK
jgi:hypothetical protein